MMVGTTSGPEMKTLTAGTSISLVQDNSANTLTVAFVKGTYVERNDNVTLGDVVAGDITVGAFKTSTVGAVTQATSLATGVTMNASAGVITLFTAAISANTILEFTLTNSAITTNSVVMLTLLTNSAADEDVGVHVGLKSVSSGSAVINITHTGNTTTAAVARKLHMLVVN